MDRRTTPANGRVAAQRLEGQVEAEKFVQGAARQVMVPVADLLRAPDGKRDRQLLAGQAVSVYEELDGWAYVESALDGYCGYVRKEALGAVREATHVVSARATHIYTQADIKSPERASLSLGSRLRVLREEGAFAKVPEGFIPLVHLRGLEAESDPVGVAERLIGAPYLWGGNAAFGIDCSGLVQAGCVACGIACPGDSDMQEARLGVALSEDAPLKRGDLLFWKGHVAWVVDAARILHANAHDMAVVYEPIEAAIKRIEEQGGGLVSARKRLEDFA
ncbi:NlpC/P60 family protein [uncultured Lentibacter sp.]|uniref:C40 family peptidase n=1 Tax=uncultured Lentibacter sp. TaxID=1659309 RepID=UPI00261224B3|nr:NlpC/P60 family protein [uncultured Lentibacter sp.]